MSNDPSYGQGSRGGSGGYAGSGGGGGGQGWSTFGGPSVVHHVHSGCVHVHHDGTGSGGGGSVDLAPVLARLDAITQLLTEAHLSDIPAALQGLTDAIAGVVTRVDEDVAHLLDLLAQQSALLEQAMANDASDASAIADLTAQNQALVDEATTVAASITDATAGLAAIDPLTDFPAPPAP